LNLRDERMRTAASIAKNGLVLFMKQSGRRVQPVFRFAPSPNGYLHLGHAFSALTNFDAAQGAGGRFLLRIEDIDQTRSRSEYERAIYEDLTWLGIAWESPVRRQSEHMADYAAALAQLTDAGLVYASFMSRQDIAAATAAAGWPRDPDGAPLYPRAERDDSAETQARRRAEGAPYALRLNMRRAIAKAGALAWDEAGEGTIVAEPARWGDVIIARKETPTSYHLAVVVDDARQGVSDVMRGRDLYEATAVHVLLQRLLGLPTPRYHHHRLIVDADGRKLAKSDGDTSLRSLRDGGATPADIRKMVGL
jgi:glutamyl-Q tRNA(Asp) synthetase